MLACWYNNRHLHLMISFSSHTQFYRNKIPTLPSQDTRGSWEDFLIFALQKKRGDVKKSKKAAKMETDIDEEMEGRGQGFLSELK